MMTTKLATRRKPIFIKQRSDSNIAHRIGGQTSARRRSGQHRKTTGWIGRALFCIGLGLVASAYSADAPPETAPAPVVGKGIFPSNQPFAFWDDELLIPEVFQSHLPTTLEKYALRLWVHPHLGDFQNKDHLRLTTGVRYGLTENWEIELASDLYFSHGHGEVRSFDEYGAANLQLGTKVNLGQPWFPGWDVGAGFDFIVPIGRPPPELTDGLRHFQPFITFSHRMALHNEMRVFFGFQLDAITYTSLPGEFGERSFRESSRGVSGGWVIDRKSWHYTFEAEYDTTRWFGHSGEDLLILRPGVIWEIPGRRGSLIRGHWVIGVALSSTVGMGSPGWGASLKLRYSRDLKRSHKSLVTLHDY